MPETYTTSSLGDRIAKARARHGLSPEPPPRPTGRGRPNRATHNLPFWKHPKTLVPHLMLAVAIYLLVSGILANIQWLFF